MVILLGILLGSAMLFSIFTKILYEEVYTRATELKDRGYEELSSEGEYLYNNRDFSKDILIKSLNYLKETENICVD